MIADARARIILSAGVGVRVRGRLETVACERGLNCALVLAYRAVVCCVARSDLSKKVARSKRFNGTRPRKGRSTA